MNTVDAHVVEVIGKPELKYGKWFVRLKVNCYGQISETEQMFNTEKDAAKIKIGDLVQV